MTLAIQVVAWDKQKNVSELKQVNMILALPWYKLNEFVSYCWYWNLNINKELDPEYSLIFGMLFKNRDEIQILAVITW